MIDLTEIENISVDDLYFVELLQDEDEMVYPDSFIDL